MYADIKYYNLYWNDSRQNLCWEYYYFLSRVEQYFLNSLADHINILNVSLLTWLDFLTCFLMFLPH